MLQRPGKAYAVWHFWEGPERRFAGWYLNLQEPFRRTSIGYDTQDLELDVWIPVGEPWRFEDEETLDDRIRESRYTEDQVEATGALGAEIGAMLDRGAHWWDEHWTSFEPDTAWRAPAFPDGWEAAPVPPAPGAERVSHGADQTRCAVRKHRLASGPRSFTFESGGWCQGVALGRYGKPQRCPA